MSQPPVNDWADMMPDTVDIYAWVSQNVKGEPTYASTATTYYCRVEMKNHLIVDGKGREVLARGKIFLMTTDVIGIKSKIVLPTGYVPPSPPILAVNVVPDETGNHHVVIEIG